MTISPQLVCKVIVRGNLFNIEFGGEMRAGVCAAARVDLHLTLSALSFFATVVLVFVTLFFLVSACEVAGVRNRDAKSTAMTMEILRRSTFCSFL